MACALAAASFAPSALAELTVGTNVSRINQHEISGTNFWISKSDCEEKIEYTFPLSGAVATGTTTFSLWVSVDSSADCTDSTQRTAGSTQKCFEIPTEQTGAVTLQIFDVAVTADVIADQVPGVDGSGCTDSTNTATERPIKLWFLEINNDATIAGSTTYTKISVDLIPPDPPTITGISPGEGSLTVELEGLSGTQQAQILEYRVFTDPPSGATNSGSCDCLGTPGATTDTGGSSSTTSTSTSTSTSSAKQAPQAAGAGGTPSEGGAGGAGGVGGGAGGGDCTEEPSPDSCASCNFAGGEEAPSESSDNYYDSVGVGSSITVSDLENTVTYAVAVAAVDKVGNVSTLSSVACDAPAEATDFYESYRGRGGQAGGGICSIRPGSPRTSAVAPIGAGAALLLFGARRLSRRRRAARSTEAGR